MSGMAVQQAAALIEAGAANIIALVYGNNGRSVKMRYGGGTANPIVAYDTMYGQTSAGAELAMMYRRYQYEYGVPDGALAPIAINNRRNAARNPVAVMRSEISEQEYLDSRYIAEPLRLLDDRIINDGGVALIITTLERAPCPAQAPGHRHGQRLPRRPVELLRQPRFLLRGLPGRGPPGLRRVRARPYRYGLRADLRQLHPHRGVQPGGLRLCQAGRGLGMDQGRPNRHRGRTAAGTRPAATPARATCRAGHTTSRRCARSAARAANARWRTAIPRSTSAPPRSCRRTCSRASEEGYWSWTLRHC